MPASDAIPAREAAVVPRGINHLVLHVRDMEESHRFWADLMGFIQVGELHGGEERGLKMRFYGGVEDGISHHDLALVEREGLPEPPERWRMNGGTLAVNHIAVAYPDRQSWLEQVRFLRDNGAPINLRLDHGMTHSVYVNDPNGYGVEVLYELPREVWEHDIDGALNHAVHHDLDDLLADDTEYTTDFGGART